MKLQLLRASNVTGLADQISNLFLSVVEFRMFCPSTQIRSWALYLSFDLSESDTAASLRSRFPFGGTLLAWDQAPLEGKSELREIGERSETSSICFFSFSPLRSLVPG